MHPERFTIRPSKNRAMLAAVLLAGVASGAWAQSPGYRPPPPPNKNTVFEVRLRYLLAPDVGFSGFGSVPFASSYETSNNVLLGTERSITYDDGSLGQDYILSTLVGGGLEGQDRVLSPNTGATSNFSYTSESQLDPNDPSVLLFHRYASAAAPDVEMDASVGGSMGWEVNYTKYIGLKRRLGVQVGFGFNGFDSRFNDTIAADLYVQEFRHRMADGATVPELPDPVTGDDGTVTQDPYEGPAERDDPNSGNLLEWLAEDSSEQLIADGASVESRADLRSSVYNFRAGPTYSLAMGNRFAMQMGAGLSAAYFSGRFSAYEILMNPGAGENPSRALSTTEEAEWQVGGYVDASAHYTLTDRVSLFSGMQVQSGSTYTQQNEEREASVDFSSQVYIHAGMGIRF